MVMLDSAMDDAVIISAGLSVLAFISGMLGLGVAFAAIPFLGIFIPDLVHQVQLLSLC
jgi:ABC-type enterochelin transport system permease subunit